MSTNTYNNMGHLGIGDYFVRRHVTKINSDKYFNELCESAFNKRKTYPLKWNIFI